MATIPIAPEITVEEYEHTPNLFERHEFIEGRLIAKSSPTWKHSQLQLWMGALLLKCSAGLAIGSELHSKLSQNSWRIPDLAVQRVEITASEKYAYSPLLLTIELRSPEDHWSDLLSKFEDYHDWACLLLAARSRV